MDGSFSLNIFLLNNFRFEDTNLGRQKQEKIRVLVARIKKAPLRSFLIIR
ncbi:hypothetical protein SAMN04488104_101166 [Algoriphagus faecimaris]|uniref:Uncharacterized protein n=1 Tax=Algoriphagus faecimaris TaxID=686796 RepID=A0A1G6R4S8_9BACT|nr:hypothetical protein SAMN04488104_101166 [Algoriphagus faecimaris]